MHLISTKTRLCGTALALGITQLLFPLSSKALDPNKSIYQFNCQNWTRQNGLPADSINDVVQTSDGFIWLGTQRGLVRFDGLEFSVVPIALPEAKGQHVGKMHRSNTGGLWFSIHNGGFGHFDGRQFAPFPDAKRQGERVDGNTIFEARDGSVWTGSIFGLGHWVKSNPGESTFDQSWTNVMLLSQDGRGRLWAGTAEQGLRYYENGRWIAIRDDDLLKLNIYALAVTRDGDIWVGTNQGLRRYDLRGELEEVFLPNVLVKSLLTDRHGILWIGTSGHGLGRFHKEEFRYLTKTDGLSSNNVFSIFEDAEGSIWVGTQEGLSQLTDIKLPVYSATEGIDIGTAHTVTASVKGGLWIAGTRGVSYFDGEHSTNYQDTALLPNLYSRRSFEDSKGNVYIADGDKNINVLADGKLVKRYTFDLWPEAFAEDAKGVLVAVGPILYRIIEGEMQPYVFVGQQPDLDWINNLCIGKDGAIWAATNNGLFRIQNEQFTHWSRDNGFTENRVHYVLEDSDGIIWAGLANELIRIKDGRLSRITSEHGLYDNRIYAIVPDDRGYFWITSGQGFFRVAREALNAFANGKAKSVTCDAFDGLDSVKFADRSDQGYSGCKTPDGRIWFPSSRGVVMIDPQNFFVNKVTPPVKIERVLVDGTELNARQATGVRTTLAVGSKRVEFDFAALSYIAPRKVNVRYQLEGYEQAWVEAGAFRSVAYNDLPPGAYVFRLQASNADGAWNTIGDSFALQLPAPFYRTLWFYTVCGLAVGGSLFGGFRLKVRHMHAQQIRLRVENDLLESNVARRTDELANSLSLLKATLDSTADGILSIQFAGQTVSYNRQFAEMWRIPADSVGKLDRAGLRAFTATQVKDSAGYIARIDETFSNSKTEAFDAIELMDGRLFERYCKPQRLQGVSVGIVINFRDVTERKRAERTIAEASALLDSLLANTLDIIYFKDRESRFVRYSRTILSRYARSEPDALIGKNDFDLFPEARARVYYEKEQTIIRTGQPIIDELEQDTDAQGRLIWVMTTKMPWRDLHGNIIGTFGVARDVTALKEAEILLANERDLLRSLMDSSPDQIYFKDRESRFIRCSQAQAANFGVSSTDLLVGKTDFDFFTAEHAQPAFDDEQAIIRTGTPLIGKVEKETWPDGRVGWVLTSKMPMRDNNGEIIGTVGISKDISPLKEAEEKLSQVHQQLIEASRQAGMAEVATSVLHNVGNVLNSVNVSATIVAEQMRDSKTCFVPKVGLLLQEQASDLFTFLSDDARGKKLPHYLTILGEELLAEQRTMTEELGHLRKNIDHIKEIVAMQQSFAKVSGFVETVPLTELLEDALRINESALTRHEVELVRDYQFQPVLTIDRHKLMQILVNLIRNSKHACDDSGGLGKKIIVRVTRDEQFVRVAIIDNGVGIAPENLTRIFAHGFTTRKDGHGFGLHSGALVARELGGSLTAHSDGLGLGATFTIELPLGTESASS